MSSSDNKNEDAIHPQPVRESTTKKILSCGRSLPSDFVKGAKVGMGTAAAMLIADG